MLAGGAAEVRAYWGRTDGGTDELAWEASASLGVEAPVRSATALVNLQPGSHYYFRFRGINAYGEAWAADGEFDTVSGAAIRNDRGIGQTHSVSLTAVAAGSSWKYLDQGLDLGAAWRTAGFDDSAWAVGRRPSAMAIHES